MNFNILISPSKYLRIGLHLLFWIIVILFYAFLYGRLNNEYESTFYHLLLTIPVYIAATYFTLYFIIPKYLLKKKYRQFFVSSIYMVLAAAFLEIIITIYSVVIPTDIIEFEPGSFGGGLKSLDVYLRLVGIFIVVFFASSIKLLKYWYTLQQTSRILEKEKLEAELNFLKSQVHPHFLFNTLNNLYALTLKKSEKSPEVVLKLSNMLNYMLYECNEDYIPLSKEIELIKNYISLEKLRHTKEYDITFNINGSVAGKQIAPMILFPFVENSFKHGISNKAEASWINIELEAKFNSLSFNVSNSKGPKIKDDSRSKGIGLENIKKRLEMIYKNKYQLDIEETDEDFNINLVINLSNNKIDKEHEDEMFNS